MQKLLIVGNWKMHISASAHERGTSPLIAPGFGGAKDSGYSPLSREES